MPAYVIFIRERVTDPAEMEMYSSKAGPSLKDRPVKVLAFYGAKETLEGPATDGVVILEFPDMDAARDWYHSPAYQEALQHRLRGAENRVVLADGA